MIAKDLRQKNLKELSKIIDDLKAELFMLRFKNSTGQLDQPHKINLVRKDIARVFTIINEKNNEKSISKSKKTKILKEEKSKIKIKEPKLEESKILKEEKPKVDSKEPKIEEAKTLKEKKPKIDSKETKLEQLKIPKEEIKKEKKEGK